MAKSRLATYTPEIHARLVEYFRAGAFKEHAANAVRLTVAELNAWLKLGREGREPYATLDRDIRQAIADDAIRNQMVLSRAAMGQGSPRVDTKAAQWNLERKHPHLYGRQAVESTPAGAPPLHIEDAPTGDDDGVVVPKFDSSRRLAN